MKRYIPISVVVLSVVMNAYLFFRLQKNNDLCNLLLQKDQLINNGYDELVVDYLDKMKNTTDDIIKNQGRLEGIVAVVNNFKPEQNLHSALWHEGYNRGVESYGDMIDVVRKTSYEEGYLAAYKNVDTFDKIFLRPQIFIQENWGSLKKFGPEYLFTEKYKVSDPKTN